jgi:hypothetical protein
LDDIKLSFFLRNLHSGRSNGEGNPFTNLWSECNLTGQEPLKITNPIATRSRELTMQDYVEDLLELFYDEADDDMAEDYSDL